MNPITVNFYWVGIAESFLSRDLPFCPNDGEVCTFERERPGVPRPAGRVIRRTWRIGAVAEVNLILDRLSAMEDDQ